MGQPADSATSEPTEPAGPRPTVAVVGAGGRGGTYAAWIRDHPDRARVIAVADPRPFQRNKVGDEHGLPETARFHTWQELAAADKLADAVIIATQDADHVEPAKAFVAKGYHVLLEKPMAPTERECRDIANAAMAAGVMFAVCHVMRYTPHTKLLKQILDSGRIGDIMSIQHLEPVGYWHQAHSYVRGNWRREDESSPMLLSKSCHDLDWLGYIVGRPVRRVSSFGRLSHFRRENQPAGAADRCLDCAVEPECPYSAPRLYLRVVREGRAWPASIITDELTEEGVLRALRDGPYGRCVYTCDNDVVDHQVVALEFDGGITGTFTMTAFSWAGHRETQIFGTHGRIDTDGRMIKVFDFLTEQTEEFDAAAGGADAGSGHGGGDAGLMAAFVTALATGDERHVLSGPAASLESHLAVFAAERARRHGSVEAVEVIADR